MNKCNIGFRYLDSGAPFQEIECPFYLMSEFMEVLTKCGYDDFHIQVFYVPFNEEEEN